MGRWLVGERREESTAYITNAPAITGHASRKRRSWTSGLKLQAQTKPSDLKFFSYHSLLRRPCDGLSPVRTGTARYLQPQASYHRFVAKFKYLRSPPQKKVTDSSEDTYNAESEYVETTSLYVDTESSSDRSSVCISVGSSTNVVF